MGLEAEGASTISVAGSALALKPGGRGRVVGDVALLVEEEANPGGSPGGRPGGGTSTFMDAG